MVTHSGNRREGVTDYQYRLRKKFFREFVMKKIALTSVRAGPDVRVNDANTDQPTLTVAMVDAAFA